MEEIDYKKYRWFFTSKNSLVIAGKSSESNDNLVSLFKKQNKNYFVLHTKSPGSPFSIIVAKNPTGKEIEEASVFTACFSKAWKQNKNSEEVHIFDLSSMSKSKSMKSGTWKVNKILSKVHPHLELYLTKQKNTLRAVPSDTLKSEKHFLKITPGKIEKEKLLDNLLKLLNNKFTKEEILSALPAGGIKIHV
jgi:hypothetical protein